MGKKLSPNKILFRALQLSCKYLRDHPSAGMDLELIKYLVDSKSDPEGERWMAYFLNKALQEAKENET